MISLTSKVRTALALGGANLARIAFYRAGVRYGLNPVRALQAAVPRGPFFVAPALPAPGCPVVENWRASALYFSRWPVDIGPAAPDWHLNPFTGKRVEGAGRPWWEIGDFDQAVGDIKTVWEASRLDWVLALAERARSGEGGALLQLNGWLENWCEHNRPYRGPNWKCGQEASIRVMHLAMASLVLGQPSPAPALLALVELHLQRIAPTISYAVAQDNNHGVSEAAALFIGGSWLARHGVARGEPWQQAGRNWLENRVARLVGEDGSFSQYSMTYHRMVLDTLSMCELWRVRLALAPFSARYLARARAATGWLHQFTDAANGDAPNLGANDGARVLQLADTAYRDFRPSVQLAAALFLQQRAYAGEGDFNLPLHWLGVALPQAALAAPVTALYDDGGFAVLRDGPAMALLRYPRFRFRPSQCDALHLDLWVDGENLLRDAGSYSYNAEPELTAYFVGSASHNTVQFDGQDQMARWGRFLFADWLTTSALTPPVTRGAVQHTGAAYTGARGERHERAIDLQAGQLQVRDQVAGFERSAVLRWRLAPAAWQLDGNCLTARIGGRTHTLTITAAGAQPRLTLAEGWESRFYMDKTALPVLEAEVTAAADITSTYRWET